MLPQNRSFCVLSIIINVVLIVVLLSAVAEIAAIMDFT
eukprot:UN06369